MPSVVQIAESWIGAPFISQWPPTRKGCDCGGLLAGVYAEARLIEMPRLGVYDYNAPWAKGDTLYLDLISEHCSEVHESRAEPGDLILFRMGRGWGHGGIYVGSSRMIHADGRHGVCLAGINEGRMRGRQRSFWRAKPSIRAQVEAA
ncbi:MAG: C40 family peptidase [Terriglobales bacterium]